MRVLFVYPEVMDLARFQEARKEFPPFGVLYLAGVLERTGYDVDIMAASDSSGEVDLSDYDVVGVSVASSATCNLLQEFIQRAQMRPDAIVLLGGVHCHFYPELALAEFPRALAVCKGEAEDIIVDLVEAAFHGEVGRIPGMIFRSPDGTFVDTGKCAETRDLNMLPFPARHLLPSQDVLMTDRLPAAGDIRMAHVLFSRGCPFKCSFCAVANTSARYRSGQSALDELESMVTEFGIEGFAIVDDNFIVMRRRVQEICEAIEHLELSWSALSRVDRVTPELLEVMARSGCVEIKFGIESGSERMLDAMRKSTSRQQIRTAVQETTAAGIAVKAFIIHGFPGENEESTDETISLLDELGDDIQRVSVFRFVPLPGTETYNRALELGIRNTHTSPSWDGDWSRFHIHHNDAHWWGTDDEFARMDAAYETLHRFVEDRFAA